ncbi:MAG: MaoC/PaaZ C-terminal domain-containing protein [Chloroflexota bacterium]
MSELPQLVKHPTPRQLVQYAGASGDLYEIHYDQDFARSTGLPGVILHGLLKAAWLAQVVTDWAGPAARVKSFEVSYRGIDVPGRPYRCGGRVLAERDGLTELEIWGEDSDGKRTTVGTATVEKGA